MKYKALLIDDEAHCLRTLETQLGWIEIDIEIIAKASSVEMARTFLDGYSNNLDFVFLDIHMPEADGFELLDHLSLEKAHVIFVTAYDEYALKAFQHHASGYLTKPVSTDDLEALLESLVLKQSKVAKETLKLTTREGIELITLNNILFIEADGSYCQIVLNGNKKVVVSKNLKNLGLLLPEDRFLRIHSKYIVNTKYIQGLATGSSTKIIISKEYELPVSRSRKESVLKLINHL